MASVPVRPPSPPPSSPPPAQGLNPVPGVVTYGPPPALVRCADQDAVLAAGRDFRPSYNVHLARSGAGPEVPPWPSALTIGFSIDGDGRPVDIVDMTAPRDVVAAFARWRFAAGRPATGCRMTVAQSFKPLAYTPTATLLQIVADSPRAAPPPLTRALQSRGDCVRSPRRAPAVIHHPDLRAFQGRDDVAPWAAVLYDIDPEGAVRNVRVAAQGGDPALADVGAAAIASSRYHSGRPATGCYGAFSARPKVAAATPKAYPDDFRGPPDATCKMQGTALNVNTGRSYPRHFAHERVEGWALLQYDVTPQGRVTPIKIIAAQPSEAFGRSARDMLAASKPDPSVWGQTGCVVPIVYKIPQKRED